ncbi:MAG: protein-L-isoaspartate(D-aspartate) O-methyltransferase [Candidatus Margulisiibacteriota bacterium]
MNIGDYHTTPNILERYARMFSMNDNDFAKLRNLMVELQLESRGIKDKRVLDAMSKVERHKFVPEKVVGAAYDDCALPLGSGQTISQPYMVALMTELLGLKGTENILEIGTGSGYQAAVLAELSKHVTSIERLEEMAGQAKENLAKQQYSERVTVIVGDGTEGYVKGGPYDGIIVTAAAPEVPQSLIDQLAEGGRLVAPVGERFMQKLIVLTKKAGKVSKVESIGCVFVPLIGKFGWKD